MKLQSKLRFDLTKGAKRELATPPGYVCVQKLARVILTALCRPADTIVEASATSSANALKVKAEMMQRRALDVALAPGKNILMQGFMMWMSGSYINIFSIMITAMAFINPIKAIINVDDAFKRFKGNNAVDLTIPKLAFIGCNLGMVCLALWKCHTMGLLPITAADWTSFLVTKDIVETSAPPLIV